MSGLVRDYQRPDGDLDGDNVADVATEIEDNVDRARTGAPLELTDALVVNLQQLEGGEKPPPAPTDLDDSDYDDVDPQAGEQSILGNRIDVGARIRLHHICRGWADKKRIDEDENGSAELQIALDQRGLLPTVWGSVDRCRLKRSDVKVELSGEISIHFGTTADRVGIRALNQVGYLVRFDGTVRAIRGDDETELKGSLSFRVLPNGHVQVKVDLPDRTHVLLVLDGASLQSGGDATLEAGVLTRDGRWGCQLDLADTSGKCVDEDGEELDVQW